MSIRSTVRASLFVALLAPAMASADGGVIRFVGAIVEPGQCMPRVTQAGPQAMPQVSCAPAAGKSTYDPASRVVASVRPLAPEGDAAQAAGAKRYLVMLQYH